MLCNVDGRDEKKEGDGDMSRQMTEKKIGAWVSVVQILLGV